MWHKHYDVIWHKHCTLLKQLCTVTQEIRVSYGMAIKYDVESN